MKNEVALDFAKTKKKTYDTRSRQEKAANAKFGVDPAESELRKRSQNLTITDG